MTKNGRPGPGVDASGQAVVDPTKNVLDLVEAAVRRLDDLADLRDEHTREMTVLRDAHAVEIRKAESARIDAIRQIDVQAVQRASEVANIAATTLAAQVTTTAEAMRVQLTAALSPIQKSIEDLRRAQYEAQGQRQPDPTDAALVPIRENLAALNTRMAARDGLAQGSNVEARLDAIAKQIDRNSSSIITEGAKQTGARDQVAESRARSGSNNMWLGLAVAVTVGLGSFFLGVTGIVITLILRK
jgi:hypothetical protein